MHEDLFWAALGMAWVFGFAAVLIIIWHLRSKRRLEKLKIIHEERMRAMEKGVPLPEFPELEEEPGRVVAQSMKINPRWPLGVGAAIATAGVGSVAALLLTSDSDARATWPLGLIVVFIGLGMILYYYLTRTSEG